MFIHIDSRIDVSNSLEDQRYIVLRSIEGYLLRTQSNQRSLQTEESADVFDRSLRNIHFVTFHSAV